MKRGLYFVAGAGVGIYAMVKARRLAEALTPDGIRDRVAGLEVGAQLFADEVRLGMVERESELRERFGLAIDGPLQLTAADPGPDGPNPGTPDALPSAPTALEGTH